VGPFFSCGSSHVDFGALVADAFCWQLLMWGLFGSGFGGWALSSSQTSQVLVSLSLVMVFFAGGGVKLSQGLLSSCPPQTSSPDQ
jgi:hypothetical protein